MCMSIYVNAVREATKQNERKIVKQGKRKRRIQQVDRADWCRTGSGFENGRGSMSVSMDTRQRRMGGNSEKERMERDGHGRLKRKRRKENETRKTKNSKGEERLIGTAQVCEVAAECRS